MDILITILFLILILIAIIIPITALVRFIGCIGSSEYRNRVKRHPILHAIWAIAAILIIALVLSATSEVRPQRGHGLSKLPKIPSYVGMKDLPSSAKDINYFYRGGFWYFECDFIIPEKEFVKYAGENGWPLKEIFEPTYTIRSNYEVKNGLIYSNRYPNGGGTTAIYDRDTNRAYIDKSHN